ncbi:hypothetical protein Pan216_18470 [Planctomycetes bacterium Pan216]|uniref:Uncharacterized protein n=1 Tax=Kolteria novifilia TaxID=2527975 RepID=A0A518B230_9BACT|nr:hypothetical protein Pan216_18470 [Planctomycetes bacterium Pan216]
MRRALVGIALTVGLCCADPARGLAQEPVPLSPGTYEPDPSSQPIDGATDFQLLTAEWSPTDPTAPAPQARPQGQGGAPGGITPIVHTTECEFDAVSHFNEVSCRPAQKQPLWKKFMALKHKPCDDCGSLGACGCGETGPCDFTCANCMSWLNFEKRIILAYGRGAAWKTFTRTVYGGMYQGQAGVELLPFVCWNGDCIYSRWGMMFMFDYNRYEGSADTVTLQTLNAQQGTLSQLAVNRGETFSFQMGPVWRTDLNLWKVRLSPNFSTGITFDWTNIETGPPVSYYIYQVEKFKASGFDVGGYLRFVLGIGLTKTTTFGVGTEFRYTPTDVLTPDDRSMRKYLSLILQVTQNF